ncbi:MAG: hypothetical protein RJB58_887 [Pseudomonadota bacterium]|jgi:hypothetical protein
MSSTKNPDQEAENPAPMPKASQKTESGAHGSDPEEQQGGTHGGKKAKMAPHSDAPPGLEQDGCGNVIPLSQRTKEDQEKALSGRKNA